jgi:diguanylate cyclase (GGDEF)-like protein
MDDLTSLHNRRGFLAVASNHMKLADRNKKPMFLLFMDLDNLKAINDTHGHHRGDEALVILADIMNKSFRRSDVKGRMGGDEFAVFPIGTTRQGVETALKRFSNHIDAFNKDKSNPFELTVSMGISWYDPKHPCSIDELLVRADKRMYEEKRLKSR